MRRPYNNSQRPNGVDYNSINSYSNYLEDKNLTNLKAQVKC